MATCCKSNSNSLIFAVLVVDVGRVAVKHCFKLLSFFLHLLDLVSGSLLVMYTYICYFSLLLSFGRYYFLHKQRSSVDGRAAVASVFLDRLPFDIASSFC